jgi:hypothetical protein
VTSPDHLQGTETVDAGAVEGRRVTVEDTREEKERNSYITSSTYGQRLRQARTGTTACGYTNCSKPLRLRHAYRPLRGIPTLETAAGLVSCGYACCVLQRTRRTLPSSKEDKAPQVQSEPDRTVLPLSGRFKGLSRRRVGLFNVLCNRWNFNTVLNSTRA